MLNRRDALKSLALFVGTTSLSVMPVTTQEAADAQLVILKSPRRMSREQCEQLRALWIDACTGTDLQRVKAIVLSDGLSVEIVRGL